MWRDTNAFLDLAIPAICYAPRAVSHATTKSLLIKDLTDAALVYARRDGPVRPGSPGHIPGAYPYRHKREQGAT